MMHAHDIMTNGIKLQLGIYGAPKKIDSLDKYRYLTFVKNTRKNKRVQLSCLPPKSASAQQHLYRLYYQVQMRLGNPLNPEDWGWEIINDGQSYSNVSNTAGEDSYDIDEETREPLLFEESIEIQEDEEGSDEDIIVEVALEDYQSD
ncbi:hypothetical protein QE152_g36022 [Popillia japonica]|uniref:Uncharacterized protein n=1 Tax=Popillia japonica TaxID=7064 RepID=A0AAW1IEB2_POPJA